MTNGIFQIWRSTVESKIFTNEYLFEYQTYNKTLLVSVQMYLWEYSTTFKTVLSSKLSLIFWYFHFFTVSMTIFYVHSSNKLIVTNSHTCAGFSSNSWWIEVIHPILIYINEYLEGAPTCQSSALLIFAGYFSCRILYQTYIKVSAQSWRQN